MDECKPEADQHRYAEHDQHAPSDRLAKGAAGIGQVVQPPVSLASAFSPRASKVRVMKVIDRDLEGRHQYWSYAYIEPGSSPQPVCATGPDRAIATHFTREPSEQGPWARSGPDPGVCSTSHSAAVAVLAPKDLTCRVVITSEIEEEQKANRDET